MPMCKFLKGNHNSTFSILHFQLIKVRVFKSKEVENTI